jgi:hypothetical protein
MQKMTDWLATQWQAVESIEKMKAKRGSQNKARASLTPRYFERKAPNRLTPLEINENLKIMNFTEPLIFAHLP